MPHRRRQESFLSDRVYSDLPKSWNSSKAVCRKQQVDHGFWRALADCRTPGTRSSVVSDILSLAPSRLTTTIPGSPFDQLDERNTESDIGWLDLPQRLDLPATADADSFLRHTPRIKDSRSKRKNTANYAFRHCKDRQKCIFSGYRH